MLLKKPLHEVGDTTIRLECLKLILEKKYVDVRCADDLGNTPLHYVLNANCYEAAILLLKRGSYLGYVNKSNNIIITNVPLFILSNHFNDCIQLKNEWTDECTIEFDYCCLMPYDFEDDYITYQTTSEMEVVSYIASNNALKHLLRHPLISSFLYIK